MTDSLHVELLVLAERVAREAGEIAQQRIGEQFAIDQKSSPLDLVTEVDRAVEGHVVTLLQTTRPNDGIVGEEGASVTGTSGIDWVIDPIDGTTSYVYGLPGYAVSIAATFAGEPVAGCVFAPAIDSMYSAVVGIQSRLNGSEVRCRDTDSLGEVLLATGFSADNDRRSRQAAFIADLLPHIRDIRRMGSAALDLAAVGAGQLDAYVESGLNPWDYMAGSLIARQAGATVIVELNPVTNKAFVAALAPGVATLMIERIDMLHARSI